MINKRPPFEVLNSRIPIIVLIKGRGSMNQGLRLGGITGWLSKLWSLIGSLLKYGT